VRLREGEGPLHVVCLPDHGQVGLELEHPSQPTADQGMVVGKHDADLLGSQLDRIRHTATVLP